MDYDPNSPQISDVIAQQKTLARRQQLIDALQKNNLSPSIQGTHGGLQAALHAITGALLLGASDKGSADQATNEKQYSAGLGDAVKSFMNHYQGTPGRELPGPPEGNGTTAGYVPPKPADQMGAVVQAMSSRYPELATVGKIELANLGRRENETFGNPTTETGPDGKPIQVLYGNRGTRRVVPGAAPDAKNVPVGNQLVNERTGAPVADLREKYGPLEKLPIADANGQSIVAQKDLSTGLYKYPPSGGTHINIDTQGNKEALKQEGDVLDKARSTVLNSQLTKQSSERILALSRDPATIQGFAAGPAAGIAAMSAKLGFTGPDAASKTQALVAETARGVLNNAAALRPLSDTDIRFLKDVEGANISLTADSIQHVASLAWAASHNAEVEARNQYNSATGVKGGEEITKLYPLPAEYKSAPPGAGFETDLKTGKVTYKGGLFTPVKKVEVRNWGQ